MNVVRKANLQKEWELLKSLSECKFLKVVASSALCSEFISSEVCLKSTGVTSDELIRLGAVYVKKPTDFKPRRILSDVTVNPGDSIRVHPYPRRYPAFPDIDWKSALIHDSEQYIVVNKPAGIPSNPTVDNYYDNIFIGASSKLNNGDDLYLPHRLDTDTSGLIVLGKEKDFTAYFGSLLRKRQKINKRYKALLASDSARTISDIFERLKLVEEIESIDNIASKRPAKSILFTSYQEKTSRCPKIFHESPVEGSLLCQLALSSGTAPMTLSALDWIKWSDNLSGKNYNQEVIDKFKKGMRCWLDLRGNSCQQSLGNGSEEHTNSGPGSATNFEENLNIDANRQITFWEIDIELITGRTHQCRGQLQALGVGLHIAGDNMYTGATTVMKPDGCQSSAYLALQANYISFPIAAASGTEVRLIPCSREYDIVTYELPSSWWQPLSDHLTMHSASPATFLEEPETDTALQ